MLVVWGGALSAHAEPIQPLFGYQTKPPNEPVAIVKSMLARDLKNLGRYGSGEIDYQPLAESFPPYDILKVKDKDGKVHDQEAFPTFGRCAQTMLVKSIKVKNVEQAPDLLSPATTPKGLKREVLVVVQAEVLALRLEHLDAIPENERCSWSGLQVKNTKAGKTEAYFDNVDDDRALLKMMKQFGTVKGNYVIIDPHRRQWEYAVSLRLPFTGKGEKRHWSRDKGDFVDATEPRWLIQDPYPPEAWHIDAAIALAKQRIKGGINYAERECSFAIANATGIDIGKVKTDLATPACKKSKEVQKDLAFSNTARLELEFLQQIKKEMSHE
ncbi:MAG: hypothetical protein EBR27_12305 [Betaproteobacteria bacterium]|nr:hypothetical protein [Betaproteobacteria bacterium]